MYCEIFLFQGKKVKGKDRENCTQPLDHQSTMAAIYRQLGSLLTAPMLQFQGKECIDHGLHCNVTAKHCEIVL
jgi:hypothetical protein